MDAETVLRQTQSPSTKKRLFSDPNRNSMKPELCLVSKHSSQDTSPKTQSKKERLLDLAQKIAQQNAENVNEMFEIMKLES